MDLVILASYNLLPRYLIHESKRMMLLATQPGVSVKQVIDNTGLLAAGQNSGNYMVRAMDVSENVFGEAFIIIEGTTNVEHFSAPIADAYSLQPNFPNPFNPSTTLNFDIPDINSEDVSVSLKIYNSLGQLVSILYQGKIAPGSYHTEWDASTQDGVKLPSGIYYAVLKARFFTQTIKMVYIR